MARGFLTEEAVRIEPFGRAGTAAHAGRCAGDPLLRLTCDSVSNVNGSKTLTINTGAAALQAAASALGDGLRERCALVGFSGTAATRFPLPLTGDTAGSLLTSESAGSGVCNAASHLCCKDDAQLPDVLTDLTGTYRGQPGPASLCVQCPRLPIEPAIVSVPGGPPPIGNPSGDVHRDWPNTIAKANRVSVRTRSWDTDQYGPVIKYRPRARYRVRQVTSLICF